jgi:hypothetical protein
MTNESNNQSATGQQKFLISRAECQAAVGREIALDDDWGWIATCVIGISRESAVINICKVSGAIGVQRKSVNHSLSEMPVSITPTSFADQIIALCCTGEFPNITIAIDTYGMGSVVYDLVAQKIEEGSYPYVRLATVYWDNQPDPGEEVSLFKSVKAMAHINAIDAIKDGRSSLDAGDKTVHQLSQLPGIFNARGFWQIMSRMEMKRKYDLTSPDRSDTYCLQQITSYIPVEARG